MTEKTEQDKGTDSDTNIGVQPVVMRHIANWNELRTVEDSEKYSLSIGNHNGWIKNKETGELDAYLSSHTFYGSHYENRTKFLQSRGFNVVLANWDA